MPPIPIDGTDSSDRLSPFDYQVATVLLDEVAFGSARLTTQPLPRDGYFRTVWKCRDGTYVTYPHSWSTGMGYVAKARSYADRFKQPLPPWALVMPPMICWRLCDVALRAEQTLPTACPQSENGKAMFARIAALADGAFRSRAD